ASASATVAPSASGPTAATDHASDPGIPARFVWGVISKGAAPADDASPVVLAPPTPAKAPDDVACVVPVAVTSLDDWADDPEFVGAPKADGSGPNRGCDCAAAWLTPLVVIFS